VPGSAGLGFMSGEMRAYIASAVDVENKTLLVPLSKMIFLGEFRSGVVWQLTEIPGE